MQSPIITCKSRPRPDHNLDQITIDTRRGDGHSGATKLAAVPADIYVPDMKAMHNSLPANYSPWGIDSQLKPLLNSFPGRNRGTSLYESLCD